jgi:hypothetical protein
VLETDRSPAGRVHDLWTRILSGQAR